MVLAGFLAIFTIISGFEKSVTLGVISIILAPILFLLYVLFLRVLLETIVVVFRIGEHVRDISNRLKRKSKTVKEYEVGEVEEEK